MSFVYEKQTFFSALDITRVSNFFDLFPLNINFCFIVDSMLGILELDKTIVAMI